MSATLRLEVVGRPTTKGNHRVRADGRIYDASRNLAHWVDAICWTARLSGARRQGPFRGALRLEVAFELARPKRTAFSAPIGRGRGHGDLDKLVRAVNDALVMAGLMLDDAQVVDLRASKRWAEPGAAPGAVIELTQLEVAGAAR